MLFRSPNKSFLLFPVTAGRLILSSFLWYNSCMFFTHEQQQGLVRVAREHHLRFIILHGSYATGRTRSDSDLDIAIVGTQQIETDSFLQIYSQLAEIFGDNAQRPLDLKTLDRVDDLFRYLVVRDGQLLYGNSFDYAEFKALAFRKYMDSTDLRHLKKQLLEKSIAAFTLRYGQ